MGYISAKCSDNLQLDQLQYTLAANRDCLVSHGEVKLDPVQTISYVKGWDLLDFR